MEFRTKVDLPVGVPFINHEDGLMMWGSCFAENMGRLFVDYKFRCDVNPFGVLYNPYSIARSVCQVAEGYIYNKVDLREAHGVWYSLMHHSAFSSPDADECLEKINTRLSRAAAHLRRARWVMFTWGTAWIYEWKEDGRIVGNCHKLPGKYFTRRLLEVEEITDVYVPLIEKLSALNPDLHFLFTVSPIRHVKDGMHGNQVSKSVLLLAAQKLVESCPNCFYFPSYEIMMDELRDYRFYADDMLHPSQVAVDYMWECFGRTFFSPATRQFLHEWERLKKGLAHRPFDPDSEAYQRFLSQILLNIEELKEKLPYLDVQNEISLCQARLKK